jgi:CRISPR-associated protein Cas5t
MTRLYIQVQAPFAAFRGFEAGDYLATAPTITYSAAWGLLLNFAGVETRLETDLSDKNYNKTTLIRSDAPPLKIAIGSVKPSTVSSLYQHSHVYTVGNTDKLRSKNSVCPSYKQHIRPCRKEFLVDFDVQLAVEGDPLLLERLAKGIQGDIPASYGIPFLGDNSFLIDCVKVLEEPLEVPWYERLGHEQTLRRGSCRLTVGIDRADSSRTTVALVAPSRNPSGGPPEAAWFWVPRASVCA